MKQIKFSHSYPKLWGQKKAELIAVRILDAQAVDINNTLKEYDTLWEKLNPDGSKTIGYYALPKEGKLIQLIFIGDKDIPFCTIRSYNIGKYEFYIHNVGQIFEIAHTP